MATESDYNSYKALIAKSPQACEFCDQQFKNRFSSIVHNSSHIIIPLLKHQICYCEICYTYFTSINDFNIHTRDRHNPVVNNNNDTKYDMRVPEIKLEKLPLNTDNGFEVKEEIFNENDYDEGHSCFHYEESSSGDETLLEIVKRETERNYIQDEYNDEGYTDLIKNQLKFEVDHEYGGLLNDFTTDCEVNLQYMWYNNKNKDTETFNKNIKSITNNIVYEDPVDEFEFDNSVISDAALKSDEEYESVHYSDLMSFGFYCCKYCCVYFPNRFSLIVHETTHMRIKKVRKQNLLCPQCDVYIAGNYRTVQKHEAAVHGTICPYKRELRTCDICGLRYRKYTRHIKKYHPKVCEPLEGLKKTVKVQEVKVSHLGPVQEREMIEKYFTIKVCDLCYSFFKNTFKKIYILKGTFSYTTERPCDECKKLFFKLKTVRTIIRIHKSKMNHSSARSSFSNENRLKKIQSRLKRINKLGKVYNYLLLFFLSMVIFTYFYRQPKKGVL